MLKEANVDDGAQNEVTALQKSKHGTRELKLQIEFEIKVNETNEANRYMPYARTKGANRPLFSGLRSLDGRRTKLRSQPSAPG